MLTHSLIQYLTLPATPPSPVALAAGVRFIHKARLYEREIKDSLTEIINAYDTPDMIRIIKERFWLYDGNDYRKVREIYIYPDASGDSRKSSNASTTDIPL